MNIDPQDSQLRGSASIDPITFEVIRHKLEAITEEQAITLRNVSGSPVVTDSQPRRFNRQALVKTRAGNIRMIWQDFQSDDPALAVRPTRPHGWSRDTLTTMTRDRPNGACC